MDLLLDALSQCRTGALDTVVHIGVGPAGPGAAAGLDARRWVLVEGDPDHFAALEATIRHGAAAVQALQAVVMPQAGPTVWHRCSVRRWNGPRSTEPLLVHYPRLQTSEPLTLDAVSLRELLSSLDVPESGVAANALILDLPGQEAALLSSVPAELLQRFEWIALRGAARGYGPGWGTLADAESVLRGHGFESVPIPGEPADPLWPVALLRLDRTRHRLTQVQQALDTEQRRADAAAQALARLQVEHRRQVEGLQHRVHELEPLHASAIDRIDQLTRELASMADRYEAGQAESNRQASQAQAAMAERDAARELAQQLQARVAAAEARQADHHACLQDLQRERQRAASLEDERKRAAAALAEATREREALRQQAEVLQRRVHELEPLHASATGRLDQLTRELAALTGRHDAVQAEAREQASLAQAAMTERDAARELAQQLQARVAAAEARQSSAEAQLSALEIEMAALGSRLTTAQAEIGTQSSQTRAALADQGSARELAQQMVAREAVADARQSSAQLQLNALRAEVAALESQLTTLRSELGTQTSQTQAAVTERDAARDLAQRIEARAVAAEVGQSTAQAQLETTRAELAALERRLAAAQAEAAQALQGGRDTIARLEDEAAQLRLRQRLMDDEIVKAEGQIELIKDVLLRDPGL